MDIFSCIRVSCCSLSQALSSLSTKESLSSEFSLDEIESKLFESPRLSVINSMKNKHIHLQQFSLTLSSLIFTIHQTRVHFPVLL